MKRLVVDLDGPLTVIVPGGDYACEQPNRLAVQKLKDYKARGFPDRDCHGSQHAYP
jgi:hypothetical protein